MAKSIEKKTLSVNLPTEMVNKFRTQVNERGYTQKRALGGAIKLWLSLPVELQVFIISCQVGEDAFMGLLDYLAKNGSKEIGKLREIISHIKTN